MNVPFRQIGYFLAGVLLTVGVLILLGTLLLFFGPTTAVEGP